MVTFYTSISMDQRLELSVNEAKREKRERRGGGEEILTNQNAV